MLYSNICLTGHHQSFTICMQNKGIKLRQNSPLRRKQPRFNDEAAVDGLSCGVKALSTRMPSWKELKSKVKDATYNDVLTILDYYRISKTNLLYMCAGSTFAYSFASQHPARTTGYIVGIASWILHSQPSSSSSINCNAAENDVMECAEDNINTPNMHSLSHRMAMKGFFGPKWMVSWLAGGIVGSMSILFSSIPPEWVGKELKKELSDNEIRIFDEKFPDGVEFVELMKWIHNMMGVTKRLVYT